MATITYQQLHIENLFTINYSSLVDNFKTLDKFIKDFSSYQRRLNDLQKSQKAASQQLTNFKISTQNTFSTINQVLDSREGFSKGSINLSENEEIKQIKKSFSEVKKFITENTRDQHEAQKTRDQEQTQQKEQLDKKIQNNKKQIQANNAKTYNLQSEIRELKLKLASKNQLQNTKFQLNQVIQKNTQVAGQLQQIQSMLNRLNVSEFKQHIDKIQSSLTQQLNQLKRNSKLKADISDTLKLEEMILNLINFIYQHSTKKFADKSQTKKALVFLEKRINKLIENIYGEDGEGKDALLTAKTWKCVSCAKDLGEMEGKLDKYKPWSIFPAKQSPVKDRYSGFGAGFQSIIQTSISKKGVDATYDQKGRMTTPFNLTRQVQSNLKSQSQSKLNKEIGMNKFNQSKLGDRPLQMQTNFMNLYGKNTEVDIDLKDQYSKKYHGLLAFIKIAYDANQHNTQN